MISQIIVSCRLAARWRLFQRRGRKFYQRSGKPFLKHLWWSWIRHYLFQTPWQRAGWTFRTWVGVHNYPRCMWRWIARQQRRRSYIRRGYLRKPVPTLS